MKQLLIDAGNSRLKWARAEDTRPARIQSAAWSARSLPALARRAMRAGRDLDAILVCNVAGGSMERALRAAARVVGAPAPRFAGSTRFAGGVRNGYRVPRQLGVDRWLAMIGARAAHPDQSLCIISCGTATTVDLLDSRGRHRGGAIVPGPELMVQALLRDTALIRRRAQRLVRRGRHRLFVTDTRAAIEAGALHARRSLIAHALREASLLLHAKPRLVITGGGAAEAAAGMRAVVEPNLVFAGLLALARLGKV